MKSDRATTDAKVARILRQVTSYSVHIEGDTATLELMLHPGQKLRISGGKGFGSGLNPVDGEHLDFAWSWDLAELLKATPEFG